MSPRRPNPGLPRPETLTPPQAFGLHRAVHGYGTAGPWRRLACRVAQVGALLAGGEARFDQHRLGAAALAGMAAGKSLLPAQKLNPAHHFWHASVRQPGFAVLRTGPVCRNPGRQPGIEGWHALVPAAVACPVPVFEAHPGRPGGRKRNAQRHAALDRNPVTPHELSGSIPAPGRRLGATPPGAESAGISYAA